MADESIRGVWSAAAVAVATEREEGDSKPPEAAVDSGSAPHLTPAADGEPVEGDTVRDGPMAAARAWSPAKSGDAENAPECVGGDPDLLCTKSDGGAVPANAVS
jgi:hypothetical protein